MILIIGANEVIEGNTLAKEPEDENLQFVTHEKF